MADEGFREIQLSGKQLIALFMTAAVVLIATFLCGVLVGRGVRAQQEPATSTESMQTAAGAVDPTAPVTTLKPAPSAEPPALQAPPAAPPPPPEEDPALHARGQATPSPAAVGAASDAKAASAQVGSGPAADTKAKDVPAAVATPAGGEPAAAGFYLKVVAYRDKAQADKMASRLAGRGYASYVEPVTGRGAVLYSVRVGKFPTRTEADAAKRRLEQQEQLKPSIAR
jgi:cell division septation protein DedD